MLFDNVGQEIKCNNEVLIILIRMSIVQIRVININPISRFRIQFRI